VNHRIIRCPVVLVSLLLFGLGAHPARAANAPVSGSYELIQRTDLGSRTKVVVRLRLTNKGHDVVYVQKILLGDFGQAPIGAAGASAIVLRSRTAEETTQEFVIPRLQFDQWQRGLRPRLILDLQTPTGARIMQAVRLERVPAREGK